MEPGGSSFCPLELDGTLISRPSELGGSSELDGTLICPTELDGSSVCLSELDG